MQQTLATWWSYKTYDALPPDDNNGNEFTNSVAYGRSTGGNICASAGKTCTHTGVDLRTFRSTTFGHRRRIWLTQLHVGMKNDPYVTIEIIWRLYKEVKEVSEPHENK